MKRKKYLLIWCILVSICNYISALEPVNTELLSKKIVFEDKSTNQFKLLFKGLVSEIDKNLVGNKLFKKINELFRNPVTEQINYLFIIETTGSTERNTAFSHRLDFDRYKDFESALKAFINPDKKDTINPDKKDTTNSDEKDTTNSDEKYKHDLYLYVNMENAVKCNISLSQDAKNFYAESECLYGPKILIEDSIYVYPVSKIWSPFYITLFHEFIHLKHFLDTLLKRGTVQDSCRWSDVTSLYQDLGALSLRDAATIRIYRDLESLASRAESSEKDKNLKLLSNVLPELEELSYPYFKRVIPWSDFEERRTVCGPDIDYISEMAFRISEDLPLRYIYQGQHFFWESPNTAEKIIKYVIDDLKHLSFYTDLETVLGNLQIGFFSFNIQKLSSGSYFPYSPLKIRLTLFNDAKIISQAYVNSRNKETASKFLEDKRKEIHAQETKSDSDERE